MPRYVITPEIVRDIREKRTAGLSIPDIIRLTGYSYNSISRHTRGLTQHRRHRNPRQTNQRRIVQLLREHGSLSSAELAEFCGMSLSYIYNLTHFLREEGTLERYGLHDNGYKVYFRLARNMLDPEYREREAA